MNDTVNNLVSSDVALDSEQLIQWIESRRTVIKFTEPAPNETQTKQAIHCAMTAPDHKKLKPWRFVVTRGETRQALAKALVASAVAQHARAGKELDDKLRTNLTNMPLTAPVIITVVTRMRYHEKVPYFEQMLSAGACVQNLILALQAQGFSTIWRTSPFANEPDLKRYFNVGGDDYIAGFIYAGTATQPIPTRKAMDIDEYVRFEG